MRDTVKAFISLLIALTLVTGCSRISLAYRHLDVIIPWSLSDYLDMNT